MRVSEYENCLFGTSAPRHLNSASTSHTQTDRLRADLSLCPTRILDAEPCCGQSWPTDAALDPRSAAEQILNRASTDLIPDCHFEYISHFLLAYQVSYQSLDNFPRVYHLLDQTSRMQQSKSHVLSRTSAAPRQGHRTVFRVTNYTSQKAQPHGSDEPSERIYHPRRPHRKSRSGCSNCKQRRVKVRRSLGNIMRLYH